MKFLGYVYDENGRYASPAVLEDVPSLVAFIKQNLEAPELTITDHSDRQLLLLRGGVDLFNDLGAYGIHLPDLCREARGEDVVESGSAQPKPDWEVLYDSIGLSSREMRMRQRVKRDCLAAKTVSDVVDLLKGTYFSVYFYSKDQQQCWGNLDETTLTAEVLLLDEDGYWHDSGEQVVIPAIARVTHLRSGEDIHDFILLDPPGQGA